MSSKTVIKATKKQSNLLINFIPEETQKDSTPELKCLKVLVYKGY